VALLPWGDVFEDWLDPLGVTPEQLRDEVTGSWMFGYVDALRTVGVETVLLCFTSRVTRQTRCVHRPTGATLYLVPSGPAFASVSRHMLREPIGESRDPIRIARVVLRNFAPYLATPVTRLVRLVRREQCAAILCQEYETPRFDWSVVAGALTRVPVFASFQGGDYHVSRLEGAVRRFTINRADRLIVPTATEVERIHRRYGLADGKIVQIFNPIDIDVWRPGDRAEARSRLGIGDDVLLVVWHGQLQMSRKGLDLLLDAWAELVRTWAGRSLRLLLIGAGEDSGELRRRVDELGLDVHILAEWINSRDRMVELLSAGDLYVFPSRHEGFPVAPVEAMACGLPVVATDVHGIPDIFARGEADGGVVVGREDVAALARAVRRLLENDERRRELGRRARARAEAAFSLSAVGRDLRRILLREAA
jgi:glycosyltransferase involved in cell wall biosynthesis